MVGRLTIENLTVSFGGIRALNDVSFMIEDGEAVGLIGPNGAGKSTVLNVLSRIYDPSYGSVSFKGQDVLRVAPHRIIDLGIVRTFQNIQLFKSLTVRENILIGAHRGYRYGVLSAFFNTRQMRREEREQETRSEEIMQMLGIADKSFQDAVELPYAEQKLVELGRALMCRPELLLLDEPMAGMNTAAREYFSEVIRKVHAETGMSMLIIEHDLDFISKLCTRVVVLNFGEKIFDGPTNQVKLDPAVVAAYIG